MVSKFSISKFIFSILFVCNLSKSFYSMLRSSFSSVSVYNFSSLLFHVSLCGLSSNVRFEIIVSWIRVGYFHKIVSSIDLWSENVVKFVLKGTVLSLFGKCFLRPKLSPLWYNPDIQGKQNVLEHSSRIHSSTLLSTLLEIQ